MAILKQTMVHLNLANWQIYDSGPIYFGTTKIAGLNTPTDTTPPKSGIPISDQNRSKRSWIIVVQLMMMVVENIQ